MSNSTNVTGAAGFANGRIICAGPQPNQTLVTVQVGQTLNVSFPGINTTQVPGPYYVFAGYQHGNGTWMQTIQCLAPGNGTNGGLANTPRTTASWTNVTTPYFNYTFSEQTGIGPVGQIGQPGDSVQFTAQPVNWANLSHLPYFVSQNYTIQAAPGAGELLAPPSLGVLALIWLVALFGI